MPAPIVPARRPRRSRSRASCGRVFQVAPAAPPRSRGGREAAQPPRSEAAQPRRPRGRAAAEAAEAARPRGGPPREQCRAGATTRRRSADFVRPAVRRVGLGAPGRFVAVRLVIAECSVDYAGRLTAHLPLARRLLLVKADGSVLVHSDGGSYKPLNWMSPPCRLKISDPVTPRRKPASPRCGRSEREERRSPGRARCTRSCTTPSTSSDVDPGLVKDGVEAHLQELLAEHVHTLGDG